MAKGDSGGVIAQNRGNVINRNPYDPLNRQTTQQTEDPMTAQYKLYSGAVQQQAQDYSNIMGAYSNLVSPTNVPTLKSATYSPTQLDPSTGRYTAATTPYTQSKDLSGAIANLQNLSTTGGYSAGDIADLRSRALSPISSVYGQANANLQRQRALSGGYAPGMGAAQANMARSMADQLSQATTNVNAGIAQNVAANKLQVAPELAGITAQESDIANRMAEANTAAENAAAAQNAQMASLVGQFNVGAANQAGQFNVANINDINRLNLQAFLQNQQFQQGQKLAGVQGMQSLYGTTPALAALFGGQALSSAQLENLINQQNLAPMLSLLGRS